MPFEIMEQRGLSASSHFFEDIRFCSERNGLWKSKDMHDLSETGQVGASSGVMSPRAIFDTSLPVERTDLQSMQMDPPRELTAKQFLGGEEGFRNAFKHPNDSLHQHLKTWSNAMTLPTSSSSLGGSKIVTDAGSHESSLFSSSLSEIFSSKMRLSANDVLFDQPVHTIVSNNEEESCLYHRKNEDELIGNLLPDEDDLFSGAIDDLGYNADTNAGTDLDDFDLFSSGGGLELEEDNVLISEKRRSDFCGQNCLGGMSGKHQLGEHPSRTLVVRNIDSNIEDSEVTVLFEQFGDISSLFTAYKHRGYVMVSYYDIRASQNAMRALQKKLSSHRKLDIHYSIPKENCPEKDINHGILAVSDLDPSVSLDELQHIFGFYGEIKDVYEIPEKHQVKFIEFYDLRASASALESLSDSKIAGRQIKLELCGPEYTMTCLMHHSHRGKDGHNIGNNFSYMYQAAATGTSEPICSDVGHQGSYFSMGQISSAYTGSSLPNCNRKASLANTSPATVGSSSAEKLVGFVKGVKSTFVPRFHAHSLPEYHDTVANGVFCNSPSNTMNFAGNIGSRLAEGSDGFGTPGNGNYPPQGLHYMWNKPNLHQQHPDHMMWQNSPPFVNGACAPHLSQMSGYPRVPLHMLRSSHIDHHVGSAPAVNGFPWDRLLNNLGESPEDSSFHLGSLGNAGFPGTWQLNPANMSPHNMFSHVGGNHMDMTANAGQSSSKQICRAFPGRNPMMSMSKHDAASERSRIMYQRRGDSNTNNADKKQFELDIERIVHGEDSRTTLMIKNIPNKYTSKMLLAAIDEQCRGTYDFIYLPIDFKNKCNVGYAFINMIDPSQIIPFYQAFNGKKWEKFNSEKVASLAYARIQGKVALIAHFQNSSLMNEDKRCRPILFHTDGPNAGDPEPFPMGTNIRSRPGKYRSSGNDEYRSQGNPSTSTGGEKP